MINAALEGLKVAFIVTSYTTMGTNPDAEATGVWLEELTTPYYHLADAGLDIDVFSISGGPIPIDPRSLKPAGENDESVERYLSDDGLRLVFAGTPPVTEVTTADYDVVFLPGGHGTMWDYPESEALRLIVEEALTSDMVAASVCHGPAGLTTARAPDGTSLLAGRRVSAFTNSEEDAAGFTDVVPFLLETRLRELGADYVSGPDFAPFAVRDGWLVTGQNPASAARVSELVLEALQERAVLHAAAE